MTRRNITEYKISQNILMHNSPIIQQNFDSLNLGPQRPRHRRNFTQGMMMSEQQPQFIGDMFGQKKKSLGKNPMWEHQHTAGFSNRSSIYSQGDQLSQMKIDQINTEHNQRNNGMNSFFNSHLSKGTDGQKGSAFKTKNKDME